MKQQTNTPQSMQEESKTYVPYGVNGVFYVYDNKAGYVPPNYGTKWGNKKTIQKMCDELNKKEATQQEETKYTQRELQKIAARIVECWNGYDKLKAENEALKEANKELTDILKEAAEYIKLNGKPQLNDSRSHSTLKKISQWLNRIGK